MGVHDVVARNTEIVNSENRRIAMSELLMGGHCIKCNKDGLKVNFDYKRYDFCVECIFCGFFGEILNSVFAETRKEKRLFRKISTSG